MGGPNEDDTVTLEVQVQEPPGHETTIDHKSDEEAERHLSIPVGLPLKPTPPDKTQQLLNWLKRPTNDTDPGMTFTADPEADLALQKEQLIKTERKIVDMFNGTAKFPAKLTENQALLLSPFALHHIRDGQIRQMEPAAKERFESLQYQLNTKNNKRHASTAKETAVQDYVKWIQNQMAVSQGVREHTGKRRLGDKEAKQAADRRRTELLHLQDEMLEKRMELRKQWKARSVWRCAMQELEQLLGKSFYDMDDFCGFHEKNASVLQVCSDMHENERDQLDKASTEAQIRPGEWEAENQGLLQRLQHDLAERESLTNQLMELRDHNRVYRNLYEGDKEEYDKLVEAVDDLAFAMRSLTGLNAQVEDTIQQLQLFERFSSLSRHVEEKLTQLLGSALDYDAVFPNTLRDPSDYHYVPVRPNQLPA